MLYYKYKKMNLHSSMVRLETTQEQVYTDASGTFTFQYGQIRNILINNKGWIKGDIYIPVWLDQKQITQEKKQQQ